MIRKSSPVVRVKKYRQPGECLRWGCSEATTGKHKWCAECREVVRKEQMRRNNIAFNQRHKRIRGHVLYNGRPTKWAIENPDKAIALARTNKHLPMPLIAFEALLELEVERERSRKEGVKIRA